MSKCFIRSELVIQLIDILTGKPISVDGRKVRLHLEKAGQPLEKGYGYYVFLQPVQPGSSLVVDAYGYQKQEIYLTENDLSGKTLRIYMNPGKQYPVSRSCYCLYGKAEQGVRLILICYPDGSLGLRQDYQAGETEMLLLSRNGKVPINEQFQIREQEQIEFLTFRSLDPSSGQCKLEAPLKGSYHARKAGFYPAKQVVTDEQGEFFSYWHREKEGKRILSCEVWTIEGEKIAVVELEAGKRVKL